MKENWWDCPKIKDKYLSLKILFIGNDTGRTGAPIILLEIAKYFTAKGCECKFVFESDGVLTHEYKTLGKTFFWNINLDSIRMKYLRWILKATFKLGLSKCNHARIRYAVKSFHPQVIYGNTGISGYLIKEFYQSHIPTIMHLHEMDGILSTHCGDKFILGLPYVGRFIAINNQIELLLKTKYAIPPEKIVPIPVFMPYTVKHNNYVKSKSSKFIVGSAGIPSHRKGTDLFIKIANKLRTIAPDIEFRWIGFDPANVANSIFLADILKNELQNVVRLTPPTSEPLDEFVQFDILALCSREDPNPLVVLESGLLRKPVVCFKYSGATHQIAEAGGGIAVEMEDVEAFCDAIITLKTNKNLYSQMSEAVHEIVQSSYDKEKNLEQIYSFMMSRCL